MRRILFRCRWVIIAGACAITIAQLSAVEQPIDHLTATILSYQCGALPVDSVRLGYAISDSIYCRGYRVGCAIRSFAADPTQEYERVATAANQLPKSSLILLAVYVAGMHDGEAGRKNRIKEFRRHEA